MIDFGVAFDKLAQFETANDLADYFASEGVQGYKGAEESCPIANWMREQTGCLVSVTGDGISRYNEDEEEFIESHYEVWLNENFRNPTDAMLNFIIEFDGGDFPQLVRPDEDCL